MALKLINRPQELLKEGSQHLSGLEEAILKNIKAVRELTAMTRTCFGPNGMNKMIINKIQKLLVTSDAATVVKEVDIIHPAAKLCVMAAEMQEKEIGDATNLVLVFAGQLLQTAQELILSAGLHPTDIISGYEKAFALTEKIVESLVATQVKDIRNNKEVGTVLRASIASKQYGFQDTLVPLIAQACTQICPKNSKMFNVDNVRVVKMLGGAVSDSQVFKGMVFDRPVEGTVRVANKAKICIFAMGIDASKTESTGVYRITTKAGLLNANKGEEQSIETLVKEIASAGVNVVVAGGTISEMAMHFFEKHKLLVFKINSKFQLRRLCRAVKAVPLVRLGKPTPEEIGECDKVYQTEIASRKCVVFAQDNESSRVSTLLIRAATRNVLDDIERAIDDGVNVYKALCGDQRFVAGAGATEVELAMLIKQEADKTPSTEQGAIKGFGTSLEIVPVTLAENAGYKAIHLLSELYAAHAKEDGKHVGLDVENGSVADAKKLEVFDHLASKLQALRLATNTAVTVLRIDQIIMARPATGPPVPGQNGPPPGMAGMMGPGMDPY